MKIRLGRYHNFTFILALTNVIVLFSVTSNMQSKDQTLN